MSTINNQAISYEDWTITANLSTGETLTVNIDVDYGTLDGEAKAQATMRMSKLVSKLLNANSTVLKSTPAITELP